MAFGITSKKDTYIKSKYKGVYGAEYNGAGKSIGFKWSAQFRNKTVKWHSKLLPTEREAALAYDNKLIELGLQPVNILKPKNK